MEQESFPLEKQENLFRRSKTTVFFTENALSDTRVLTAWYVRAEQKSKEIADALPVAIFVIQSILESNKGCSLVCGACRKRRKEHYAFKMSLCPDFSWCNAFLLALSTGETKGFWETSHLPLP